MLHTKSPTFAIFTSTCSTNPMNEVIHGIIGQAKKFGWKILIFNGIDSYSFNTEDTTGHCIFQLADLRAISGVFITQNIMNTKSEADILISNLQQNNIPVVSVGYKAENCNSIIYDECASFEKIIDHVIEEHGCKVLNLVAGMRNNVFSQNRIDAFKKSLEKHNLKFDERRMFYGEFWRTPTEQGMDDFFKSKLPLPDAFICCNDEMALTVCEKLQSRNIKVPDDVIVTGYDGIILAELNSPQLTTVKCDDDKLGMESVKFMKKIIIGEKVPKLKEIKPRMILSQSCGCAPVTANKFSEYAYITQEQISTYKTINNMQQNMVTEISTAKKISEIKKYLPNREYFGSDCWVMINNSFSDFFFKKKFTQANPFDPKIDCFFCSKNWMLYDFHPIKRSNYLPEIEILFENSYDAIVFTPITFGEEVMGYCGYPFFKNKNKLARLERFTQTLGQCFALVRDRERMEYLIDRDLLTGSFNRRGFYAELKSKIESEQKKPMYIIIHSVDMDNLKSINDTFGHSAGDFAIKTLTKAVISAAGKNAVTARFGGDEFVAAIITSKAPENFDEEFKTKLHDYLAKINKNSGKPFFVSASCGSQISQIMEFDETLIDNMMKKADNLMYKDKAFRKRNQPRSSK